MSGYKSASDCLRDVIIADSMLLHGLMTFDVWVQIIEFNKRILSNSIEAAVVASILKALK